MSAGKVVLISAAVNAAILIVLFVLFSRSVPDLRTLQLQAARPIAESRGLALFVADGGEKIADQVPAPGTVVLVGSPVMVRLEPPPTPPSEPGEAAVPPLEGAPLATAKFAIESAHLSVGPIEEESSDVVPKGMVIASEPPAGARAQAGAPVTLIVSSGPPTKPSTGKRRVPRVVNFSLPRAQVTLRRHGFTVGRIRYTFSDNHMFDRVLTQFPAAGVRRARGTEVDLTVNTESP